MIKKVVYQNFNGQSGDQPLTGKDIFLGPNGSGKSTRIQAAIYTQLGYIPGEGKTTAQIFKHSTGDSMMAGIETSSGFSCSRTIERKSTKNRKTGEVSTSLSESVNVFPGRQERTDTEKRARIEEELGCFPVMMDFEVFSKMTDTQKRDFIFNLGTAETTYSKTEVRQYLEEQILTPELLEGNKEQHDITTTIIDELMERYPENLSVEEAIAALLDLAKSELKVWKTKEKDSSGAARQLAELKNQAGVTDRDLTQKKEQLKDLQARKGELIGQIEGDKAKKVVIDARTDDIARCEKLLEDLVAPSQTAESIVAEIKALESSLDTTDYFRSMEENLTAREELANQKKPLEQKAEGLSKQTFSITTQLNALQSKLASAESSEGCCVLHQSIECPKDFSAFRAYVEQSEQKVAKALEQLHHQKNDVATEIAKIDLEIEKKKKEYALLASKGQAAIGENSLIDSQVQAKKDELRDIKTKEEKVAETKSRLETLRNTPVPAIGDLELMEKELEQVNISIQETEARVEEISSARQNLLLFQQAVINNQEAELRATAYDWIKDALGPKGLQGEFVRAKVEPLRLQLQEQMKNLGLDHEPFFEMESETGQETFDFGWVNEKGHKVYYDTLSDGQKMLFITAMQLVFMDRANPRYRLFFFDNVNHLDKTNFRLLLEGLSRTNVDNIMLAGAVGFDFVVPEGWEVWEL